MLTKELCAGSVEAALKYEGAYRIELCANLAEGGTTPSYGEIATVRERVSAKLYPIVRPRGGDFCYTEAEFDAMRRDVRACGELGCDGVVVGVLNPDRTVDTARTGELVGIAHQYKMGVTFHRAFDEIPDKSTALETLISLGVERVLTSGGEASALLGATTIKKLVEQAAGRITIMAGAGVTAENADQIAALTGCTELHGTKILRK